MRRSRQPVAPADDDSIKAGSQPACGWREDDPTGSPAPPSACLQCSPHGAVTSGEVSAGIHPPCRLPYVLTAEPHRLEFLISEGLARLYALIVAETLGGPMGGCRAESAVSIEDEDGTAGFAWHFHHPNRHPSCLEEPGDPGGGSHGRNAPQARTKVGRKPTPACPERAAILPARRQPFGCQ
jgi:hypothetical protein